jgi:hypothetical protein
MIRRLKPALLLENETKLMERKLADLQKSIYTEKNLGRWNSNLNTSTSISSGP